MLGNKRIIRIREGGLYRSGMKRHPTNRAFTLVEIIIVIVIVIILTGIVIQIAALANNRGARARATGEIAMLQGVIEIYKADTGSYPDDTESNGNGSFVAGATARLHPKEHFIPTDTLYRDSSRYLYEQLSGDKQPCNGIPDADEKRYLKDFDPRILKVERDKSTDAIKEVLGFQDPWGYYYGYSTAAAFEERKYQANLKRNQAADRPTGDNMPGFHPESYDLWSTGNTKPRSNPTDTQSKELAWAKWIKN